jgi:hypothetical protein
MLISVDTVTFCTEIFAHAIAVHVETHAGVLAVLCSAEHHHTLTVYRTYNSAEFLNQRKSRIYFTLVGQ